MRKKISFYCLTDVSAPPAELTKRAESNSFYMHISIPLPESIVVFCLGQWADTGNLEAVLTYKDETLSLGQVTEISKCLCWERCRSEVPDLMISDSEKGVARLVLEKPDSEDQSTDNQEQNNNYASSLHESTQLAEKSMTKTPEASGKLKRRNSKNEKTPNEPSAKKKRSQKSVTRLRSTKKDSDSESNATDKKMGEENTNKENLNHDLNIPNTIRNDIKEPIKSEAEKNNFKKKSVETDVVQNNIVPVSNGTKKAVACKDLTTRAARPSSRWGHSLCFVNKNMSVLVGGQGDKQQLNKDAVWTLDTETRKWRCPSTFSEGQKPEYRMGHTATYDPMVRCIYVFGGSKNTRWFHDVHVLDVDEWKWQLVKVNGKAPTRAYHSATLYRHELWIFGGVYPRPDPQPDGCSNDIHIFSPVMESWYSPIVKGEKPIPRSGHSSTLINDQMVVFGGWDAPISYSDLHILDMSIVEWTEPKVTGAPPKPRSWHASCALSGQRILIHGGYDGNVALDDTHIFNLDTMNWMHVKVMSKPSARVGHRAVCMPYRHDNEEEDEVIIFGGGDNDGAYFDDLIGLYVPFVAEEELTTS